MDWRLRGLEDGSPEVEEDATQDPRSDLSITLLEGKSEKKGVNPPSLPNLYNAPSRPPSAAPIRARLWSCSEMSMALVCAALLCIYGLFRAVDTSLPFVQRGVAARMNIAAPFVYAAAFVVSGVHYAFLSRPRVSASLKEVDVCCIAVSLAWMTMLLLFSVATQPTPERALVSDFRYSTWIDAPVSAGVVVVVFVLSRAFTPSSMTSTYGVLRQPLLSTKAMDDGMNDGMDGEAGVPSQSLLAWHATLEPAILNTEAMDMRTDPLSNTLPDALPNALSKLSPPTSLPADGVVQLEMDRLVRLARASGLVDRQQGQHGQQGGAKVMEQSTGPEKSHFLPSNSSIMLSQVSHSELVIEGTDVRSSHAHFDPAWDWLRQCLLGVLIVSWTPQLAALTQGLRARSNEAPPSVALVQSMSSIALLFSAYFQFVNCPRSIYLMGPVLWRLMVFLGVALTIVASDGLLLPWQATL